MIQHMAITDTLARDITVQDIIVVDTVGATGVIMVQDTIVVVIVVEAIVGAIVEIIVVESVVVIAVEPVELAAETFAEATDAEFAGLVGVVVAEQAGAVAGAVEGNKVEK